MKKSLYTLFIILVSASTVMAQIYVSQFAIGGLEDGSSWANAFLDIQPAIDSAETGDEVWVAFGEYFPPETIFQGYPEGDTTNSYRIQFKSIALYGGFIGNETNLEQRNPQLNPTIINGDILNNDDANNLDLNKEDNAHHLIYITNSSSHIDGFNFFRGKASDAWFQFNSGGAIEASTGAISIANCTFTQCVAGTGSAINFRGAEFTMKNCEFINNSNSPVYLERFSAGSSTSIESCSFRDHEIENSLLRIRDMENVRINNCIFENNMADAIISDARNDSIIISNCEFLNNVVNTSCIYIFGQNDDYYNEHTVLQLEQTKILNNVSTGAGVAFFAFKCNVNINNCLIANNQQPVDAECASMCFTDVSFIDLNAIDVNISNSTIAQNQTPTLDIHQLRSFGSEYTFVNSILESEDDNFINDTSFLTINNMRSFGANICSGSSLERFMVHSLDATSTDPQFEDASSGSFTPMAESVCVDNAIAAYSSNVDVNGNMRDEFPDIGALEFGVSSLANQPVIVENLFFILENPSSTTLTLAEFDEGKDGLILVHSMDGSLIFVDEKQVGQKDFVIDVSKWTSGTYIVTFLRNQRAQTRLFETH